MAAKARIGFHAAFNRETGQETGVGNALIGSYLNQIGLPDRAVIYVTRASPQSMTWLTMSDAQETGIEVSLFASSRDQPPSASATPATKPKSQDPVGRPSSSDQIAPVTQRAVLYDEDPSDPKGKQYVGSVIWRTEPVKATGNPKPDMAVRADIEIPDRKFKMTMAFRRNTDSSLPASHTAELTFILPQDFSSGGVGNVPGILMKSDEQEPSHCPHKIATDTSTSTITTTKVASCGTPLAGLAVKVTTGFFLVGLSNVDADRARNIQLLTERSWFDVPLVYANQGRATIAIEKGAPGERAFKNAFAIWGQ